MQRRSIYSLLLTSFILVFAFTSVQAQEVVFSSQTVLRGQSGALNISIDAPDPVGGFEFLFEVSTSSNDAFLSAMGISWDGNFDSLLHRYIDLSGVDNLSPDTVRMAALVLDSTDGPISAGLTLVAHLDFTANASCGGTIDVDGITMTVGDNCSNTSCITTATTQFISEDGLTATLATYGRGTIITIQNADPDLVPMDDVLAQWGEPYSGQAVGTDADTLYGPETLKYSLVDGHGWLSIDSLSGLITGTPLAAHMIAACEYEVEVVVEDSCHATASTTYTIFLWNNEPEITCPNDTVIGRLEELVVSATATDDLDPVPGPAPLVYYMVSFTYEGTTTPAPGSWTLNTGTGLFTWNTDDVTEYGPYEVCIGVHDSAAIGCDPPANPNNADTCCFSIAVIPDVIVIEKTHNSYQGKHEYVSIGMPDGFTYFPMGGFDFLIQYDASALTLVTVDEGEFIGCGLLDGWEYFTHRFGANGNCGPNACPSGIVRIVSIADMNNGPNHPDVSCYTNAPGESTELAVLDFLVSDDRTLECQYVPIRWIWYDCGDNAISSVTGDTLFLSRYIWEFEEDFGDPLASIHDPLYAFPSLFGAREECYLPTGDYYDHDNDTLTPEILKPGPYKLIDFVNGGVDIICADSIDAPGDVNLNNVPNEIADAVLFSNYFIIGLSVFDINVEGQIAATDVNKDGLTLSVADLVYLIRTVVGDVLPYNKVAAPIEVAYHNDHGILSVNDTPIGGAYVVAAGDVVPELRAANMDMLYRFDGENTRILVWSQQGNAFIGDFLAINAEVISVEMATREGQSTSAKLIPTNFALGQNYPNPFNPATTISFSLATASDYTLTVFNVTGQIVAEFSGNANAGNHSIRWDAANQASGIYFYKLDSDNFSDTKKMVLLK